MLLCDFAGENRGVTVWEEMRACGIGRGVGGGETGAAGVGLETDSGVSIPCKAKSLHLRPFRATG
jgi:hypothetical protein